MVRLADAETPRGLTFSDYFVVEVFCGKAGLSRALRGQGFQVFSIDHKAVKGLPILVLNLNSDVQCKIFEELLQQKRLLYVHFAPPCGTASLARCIKLGRRHGPRPLRSLRFPMGLKHLSSKESGCAWPTNSMGLLVNMPGCATPWVLLGQLKILRPV